MSKTKMRKFNTSTLIDYIKLIKAKDKQNFKIMLDDNNIIVRIRTNIEQLYVNKGTIPSEHRVNYVLIRVLDFIEKTRITKQTTEEELMVKVLKLVVEHVNEVIEFDKKNEQSVEKM